MFALLSLDVWSVASRPPQAYVASSGRISGDGTDDAQNGSGRAVQRAGKALATTGSLRELRVMLRVLALLLLARPLVCFGTTNGTNVPSKPGLTEECTPTTKGFNCACSDTACVWGWTINGECDPDCYNEGCDWDGGECGDFCGDLDEEATRFLCKCKTERNCTPKDGVCEDECNDDECGQDGGDCSPSPPPPPPSASPSPPPPSPPFQAGQPCTCIGCGHQDYCYTCEKCGRARDDCDATHCHDAVDVSICHSRIWGCYFEPLLLYPAKGCLTENYECECECSTWPPPSPLPPLSPPSPPSPPWGFTPLFPEKKRFLSPSLPP